MYERGGRRPKRIKSHVNRACRMSVVSTLLTIYMCVFVLAVHLHVLQCVIYLFITAYICMYSDAFVSALCYGTIYNHANDV